MFLDGRDRSRCAGNRERGHLLILLMMGITVMLILMTAAAQSWTFRMRREMELELIHRGEQYVRGLDLYRKTNGGAFPLGDLKVLAQKNPMGVRYMRKLYDNPMDPNGQWQYLYLHPGGSGFINPCASAVGVPGLGGAGGAQGAIPVSGMQLSPGQPGVFAASSLGRGRGGRGGRSGRPGGSRRSTGSSAMDQLSAMDPNTFRDTGVSKMNLPIVGVVNCEVVESIRMYQGQTWYNNWAFTPLAQGQFAGNAQAARGGAKIGTIPGIGLSGSTFQPADKLKDRGRNFSGSRSEFGAQQRRRGSGWSRTRRPQMQQEEEEEQQQEEEYEDESYDDDDYYEDDSYEEEDEEIDPDEDDEDDDDDDEGRSP